MRCRACNSPHATFQRQWEEWYCEECLDEIYDSLSEFDEEEVDLIREIYYND